MLHLGLDFDDTISAWPRWFGWLAAAVRRDGGRVTVITFRRCREDTARELARLGIQYDALETLPPDRTCGLMSWKAERCAALGVDVLFDDAPEVVNHLAPTVLGLVVRDPELGRLGVVD